LIPRKAPFIVRRTNLPAPPMPVEIFHIYQPVKFSLRQSGGSL